MKHPIKSDTINVSVNLLIEERRVLGQIAVKEDTTMSAYLRRLVLGAIKQAAPDAFRLVSAARRIRREHMLEHFNRQLTLAFAQ